MTQTIQDCLGNTGYYEERGADAVLLVHGLTGTPAEMRHIAKRLMKQGFSVMCPALAGHCGTVSDLKKSRWQDWYTSMDKAFEALKTKHERVYVSGLSMGALIGLLLAAEKGKRVDGLGLLSTTFFYDGWNMPRLRRKLFLPIALHSPLRYLLSWKENPPYGIKCERTRALVHAILENRDALASEKVGIFHTPGVTVHQCAKLIKAAKKVLPKVHSPALIVHATEDDMASVKNAHFVAQRISSERVETFFVDDTYHVLTLDKRKDDVAKRLAEFFKKCAAHSLVAA
ncbi:MAG: alpha/beta hydrolase [Methylophilaceae bacterium]